MCDEKLCEAKSNYRIWSEKKWFFFLKKNNWSKRKQNMYLAHLLGFTQIQFVETITHWAKAI